MKLFLSLTYNLHVFSFRRGPDKKGFSLGRSMNLQEIFGDDWKVVMLPVFSSLGDGLSYPERLPDLEMGLKESERCGFFP